MLTINFAKRAKKLIPELTFFMVEQKFKTNPQGYFVSRICMTIQLESVSIYGYGDTKEEAWQDLILAIKQEEKYANR